MLRYESNEKPKPIPLDDIGKDIVLKEIDVYNDMIKELYIMREFVEDHIGKIKFDDLLLDAQQFLRHHISELLEICEYTDDQTQVQCETNND
jgi:hypothetical protein